jgi:Pyruvate/2-oxoacid:ferredoxin oxidoreductase gamma subunit
VILGALSTGLALPPEAWQEGIRQSVKPQFIEINLKAFQAGAALGAH